MPNVNIMMRWRSRTVIFCVSIEGLVKATGKQKYIHPTNSFHAHSDQNENVQGNLRVKYVPCPTGDNVPHRLPVLALPMMFHKRDGNRKQIDILVSYNINS